jgi:predicted DNA-binding transcriptional regulator AlpA
MQDRQALLRGTRSLGSVKGTPWLRLAFDRQLGSTNSHARQLPIMPSTSRFAVAANNLLTRMAEMPKVTVRIVEIAEILGLSKQRASKIADSGGFPAPVGRNGQSRLWDRREVTAWAKVWRREKPWR